MAMILKVDVKKLMYLVTKFMSYVSNISKILQRGFKQQVCRLCFDSAFIHYNISLSSYPQLTDT